MILFDLGIIRVTWHIAKVFPAVQYTFRIDQTRDDLQTNQGLFFLMIFSALITFPDFALGGNFYIGAMIHVSAVPLTKALHVSPLISYGAQSDRHEKMWAFIRL